MGSIYNFEKKNSSSNDKLGMRWFGLFIFFVAGGWTEGKCKENSVYLGNKWIWWDQNKNVNIIIELFIPEKKKQILLIAIGTNEKIFDIEFDSFLVNFVLLIEKDLIDEKWQVRFFEQLQVL